MQALTTFYLVIVASSATQLPSFLEKCDRHKSDFKQCMLKAANIAVSQFNRAIPSIGLINLEPLEIPFMAIAPGNGPAHFDQNYTDLKLSGLTTGKFSKFELDFDKKILAFEFTVPQVRLNFTYDAKGQILILPLYGHGPALIILDDVFINCTFNLEEYDKNGQKHYKIIQTKLSLEPNGIHYQLDNLFNGDERLGNEINKVLNENWRDLYADVKSGYDEAYGKVITHVIQTFFKKVSISEMFE